MSTKVITIHVDDEEVQVTLKSAKKDDGLWRAELMSQAAVKNKDKTDQRALEEFYTHPTCVAAVKDPDWVRNMPFDDFMSTVDEADIITWTIEAYELNPQWKAGMVRRAQLGEEEEKKIGTPSNGSPKPTGRRTRRTATSQPLKS